MQDYGVDDAHNIFHMKSSDDRKSYERHHEQFFRLIKTVNEQ